MHERIHRAEQNELAFQSYNQRRAAAERAGQTPSDEPVQFVCECDDPACWKAIELRLGEYELAVSPVDRFLVSPGHQDPAVEVVVEEHDGYLVVSKPSLRRRSG
jgi:hypothetical protein